jgi:thermitase
MKGLTEILLSGSLATATLLTYSLLLKPTPHTERFQPTAEPIASNEPWIDADPSLNWGFERIHTRAAWMRSQGSRNVLVAVIDTGCDVHHPDLQANIWVNPGESGMDASGNPKASNGLDDDANGFIDDVHGWNFAEQSADVSDEHGHGTHVAGIIGATPSSAGPMGVAPKVSLMILKYYAAQTDGKQNLLNTIAAIRYAVQMGADIINYSGGGILRSGDEEEALRWAAKQGVLVVAAAGNDGLNTDFFHFYPADYELPNIVSVAAVDQQDRLIPVSNYGLETVDIAAPGKNIFSTLPNGEYGYMTGTSQATAFVTGVAALMIAKNPQLREPRSLIQHLLMHAQELRSLKGKLRSASLLDAQMALDDLDLQLTQSSLQDED